MKLLSLAILLLLFSMTVLAQKTTTQVPMVFANQLEQDRFDQLTQELRCLVCQNQNIAESNAELAKDLRLEIYTMLQKGQTEDEIVDFMVERYGDYVLYRPPFKPMTWLLWFGPLMIFVLGIFYAIRFMKSQSSDSQLESLSEEEIERVKSLHADIKAEQGDK